MKRAQDERGQSVVVVVLFMTVILGMAAVVIDVGTWYRADRAVQSAADAAALGGAHALPGSPGQAQLLALEYADKNGGGIDPDDIQITSTVLTNDTITVTGQRPSAAFFARIFGVDSATVEARAKARTGNPSSARWAAPIGVDKLHPKLSGGGCPCFNQWTSVDMYKVGPGAFRLLNLDDSYGGSGTQIVGNWIERGYEGFMPVNNWYYSNPGIKPNSSNVTSALDARLDDVLLFPVYGETQAQGAGFEYRVVGWVGFHLDSYVIQGSNRAELYGWFTSITWEGVLSESADEEDFGVRVISLVE